MAIRLFVAIVAALGQVRGRVATARRAGDSERGASVMEGVAWAAGMTIAVIAVVAIVRGVAEGWANLIPGGP